MTHPFFLAPQLQADTLYVCDLPLCHVRLMNNASFPWLVLIPRVADLREMSELPTPQRHQLMDEICHASTTLQRHTQAEKMNIGALGNMVPQLHIHVIARFSSDAAWPNPVWGAGGKPYGKDTAKSFVSTLAKLLNNT